MTLKITVYEQGETKPVDVITVKGNSLNECLDKADAQCDMFWKPKYDVTRVD